MIAWFAKNDVAANLLLALIVILGGYSLLYKLPLEVFPAIEIDRVTVNMVLPGASPEEVEKGLTIRIEEAIQDLEGIKEMTSSSAEGRASVSVEVEKGYDKRELMDEIKTRVDAIPSFPASAEKPRISIPQFRREVISVLVYGDVPEKQLRNYADVVRDELTAIPGITQLNMEGVRNYEISIEVSEAQLKNYGISLQTVADVLRASSLDLSAGNIKTRGGDILVRTKSQAFNGEEFANIEILAFKDGSSIQLKDIATIRDGFEESPVRSRFNGLNAVEIEVFRIGEQSAIDVAEKVFAYLDAKKSSLPQGIKLGYWRDRSNIIKNRLETLTWSAVQGLILVMILLTLFLRPAVAFWVIIGVPVSFLGALAVLPIFGITINALSLLAFIVVLGIVVDDAIVTGENVYTHLQNGEDPLAAAIKGTQEVAVPVTFGVLTTIVAFLSLLMIEGRMTFFYQQIPAVVAPVLLFSLIESKFVLPAHLKHVRIRNHEEKGRLTRIQESISQGLERGIEKYYQPFLEFVIKHRYSSLAVMLGVFLLVITSITSGLTRYTPFPRIESEVATASLSMPVGTSFEVTDRYIQQITEKAQQIQEKYKDPETGESVIMHVMSYTGSRGGQGNAGRVRFEIVPPERRTQPVSSIQLVTEWRKLVGQIPGAESLNYRAEIGRSRDPIAVRLSGTRINDLEKAGDEIRLALGQFPEIFDIADTMSNGKEELQFTLKPEARNLGITVSSLARQVRQAFFGFEVQRIQRGRDEVRIYVRYPRVDRNSVGTLETLLIRTPSGGEVPFLDVATVSPGRSPNVIQRVDRRRTISITADVDKKRANMTVLKREVEDQVSNIVAKYPGLQFSMEGEAREQRESNESMKKAMWILGFVVFALLAIPFKSYLQPLIVMSVIPFGLIGAVIGHWIMGLTLSTMSQMGMLALVGVVINDSLVLVDFINKKRAAGMALQEAVRKAGVRRFRPVLLTSLTTFVGLIPLYFEKSTQAQFLIPMAVSLGFGILFATIITLLVVPINYLVLEDLKHLWRKVLFWFGWRDSVAPKS